MKSDFPPPLGSRVNDDWWEETPTEKLFRYIGTAVAVVILSAIASIAIMILVAIWRWIL